MGESPVCEMEDITPEQAVAQTFLSGDMWSRAIPQEDKIYVESPELKDVVGVFQLTMIHRSPTDEEYNNDPEELGADDDAIVHRLLYSIREDGAREIDQAPPAFFGSIVDPSDEEMDPEKAGYLIEEGGMCTAEIQEHLSVDIDHPDTVVRHHLHYVPTGLAFRDEVVEEE